MRVTSDFECGNGKNIAMVRPGHFRLDEVGEQAPYCKYFCVRLEAEGDGGRVRLDVYPDPLLGESGREGMMGHYPSQLWYSTDAMATWRPLESRLEGTQVFHESHISAEVMVEPRGVVYVASNAVVSYSHLVAWAEEMRGQGRDYLTIGTSFQGHPIPAIRIADGRPGAQPAFILAGQHPSEHCGVMAAMGVAEFLASEHPEAVELCSRYDFWVVPMINVDGNANGRNGWTMQDVNPFGDFAGASEGSEPRAVENAALWHWLRDAVRPAVSLHFHGYMGKRGFYDYPYDGLYAFADPESVYGDRDRVDTYRAVQAALAWDTDGLTGHGRPSELSADSVDYQLACAFGTVGGFYEINHGYHGVWASKRKGATVLRALLRGIER